MHEVGESIEVNAPVSLCYRVWSDLTGLPRFMPHVESVQDLGGGRTAWVTKVAGSRESWRAMTTAQEENRLIAWQAEGDVGMDGRVEFEPAGEDRTLVRVMFVWRGGGIRHGIGHALGLDEQAVKRNLEAFKEHVERSVAPYAFEQSQVPGGRQDPGQTYRR
jgi:uncharacterized membrane protein